MDRTEGSNFIDIGAGRRGFQDQNAEAGVPGTRVTASYLNAIQEEIMAVIENAGLTADKANWQQLDAAIRKLAAKIVNDYNIPLAQLNCLPWLPVISLTQKTPPANPAPGDIYIVPDDGKSEWSDKAGRIAEWNGSKWLFSNAKDGHGIGLPDGSVFVKVDGQYQLLRQLFQNSFDLRYSQLVAPPADTFYVIGPSGSDKNTGLKPTPEDGFATIQGAIDALSGRYITQGTITLKISPGTYEGFSVSSSLVQKWEIIGDQKNRTAYRIRAKNNASRAGIGCAAFAAYVVLRGLSFQTDAQNIVSTTGAAIDVFDCSVTATSTSTPFASYGGRLAIYGQINVTGAGGVIFDLQQGGCLDVGYKDQYLDNTAYVNFSNCQCISVFSSSGGSIATINPINCKFSGSIVGRKYTIELNAIILTYGGGANFLPGDSAGIITTGGQFS